MGKIALIVAGGQPPSKPLLYRYIMKADIIIGADKGAECLIDDSIKTFAVIGDFDSIDKDAIRWFKDKDVNMIKAEEKKDETDTMLAVQLAVEHGADTIYILGGLGKRLDHQFANISILMYARKKGADAWLIDDNNRVCLLKDKQSFETGIGDHFSVFSLSKRTEFLSSEGLKFSLNGLVLRRDTPIGVSNMAESKIVTIAIKQGQALMIQSYE